MFKELFDLVQDLYPGKSPIPLHEPLLNGNEKKYLNLCIDSGYVSSVGEFVNRFEKEISNLTGSKNAIAVVNGTQALHLALYTLGIGPGKAVLAPSLTFVATINSIYHNGASPIFLDIEDETLGICPDKARAFIQNECFSLGSELKHKASGLTIAAIMPTHVFGHASRIKELSKLADDYSLHLIEDAAEGVGSRTNQKHLGTFGTLGVLSFNGNKTLTTGGGGIVLTEHNSIAQQLKHLSTTARVQSGYELEHDMPGFNYRMPNLNAALGMAQLESLPHFLHKKRSLALNYQQLQIPHSKWLKEPKNNQSNYWLNAIQLDSVKLRNNLLNDAHKKGILCRPIWKPIHNMTAYAKFPKDDLSTTENLSLRIVCLPSGLKGLNLKSF
tara:strand:- start:978 stop:2132 length:1155 start_codon:yes stop_codon:yes gene_type:complete